MNTPQFLSSWWHGGGTVWPVAQRELRATARQPATYSLRVWSAAIAILIFVLVLHNSQGNSAATGITLFSQLHLVLIALIVCTVPMMTADCVAREKREGTLGLLFLTPLTARGIVIGKTLVQGLRAFSLWLAAVPLLIYPFLLGGVNPLDAWSALAIEFCAVILCVSAGLLASSFAKTRAAALVWAVLLAVLFLLIYSQWITLYQTLHWFTPTARYGWKQYWQTSHLPMTRFVMGGIYDVGNFKTQGWSAMVGRSSRSHQLWVENLWTSTVLVLLFLWVAISLAGASIKRSWQDKGPSRRGESWTKLFCTPLARRRFSRRMQRSLDSNPIAWLQQYSWKTRLTKWGLCCLFLLIVCAASSWGASVTVLQTVHVPLLLALALVYTFVGVNSFLAEKQNGALELLLITPLKVHQIILGRAIGLWKQFLPAASIVLLLQAAILWISRSTDPENRFLGQLRGFSQFDTFAIGAFLSLPFFATYFALRVKHWLLAFLLTWCTLSLVGAYTLTLLQVLTPMRTPSPLLLIGAVGFFDVGFVLLTFFLLHHSLSRRIYSF